jgi:hypothetical protein
MYSEFPCVSTDPLIEAARAKTIRVLHSLSQLSLALKLASNIIVKALYFHDNTDENCGTFESEMYLQSLTGEDIYSTRIFFIKESP